MPSWAQLQPRVGGGAWAWFSGRRESPEEGSAQEEGSGRERPAGRQVPFGVPGARPPSQARLVSSLPKAGTQQQLGGDPGAWLPNAGHLQPGLPASHRLGDSNMGEETQDGKETMSMTR